MQLSLAVPGLFQALTAFDAPPAAPALQRLIARGRRREPGVCDRHALPLGLFGLTVPAGRDAPVAAPCRLADGAAADDGCWLRADPVHLVVDRDRVYLGGVLELAAAETASLLEACNPLLAEEGMRLEASPAGRWYLQVPEPPAFTTVAPAAAVGGDVATLLPPGPEAAGFRGLLTELQMLLHDHPVNTARAERGEAVVNSLWPWGAGRLPAVPPGRWQAVWTGDAGTASGAAADDACLARGLALQAGLPVHPLPQGLDGMDGGEGAHLAVLAPPTDPAVLERLDAAWFGPALTALRRGRLGSLGLFTEAGAWLLGRGDARRWWRRRRPLVGTARA